MWLHEQKPAMSAHKLNSFYLVILRLQFFCLASNLLLLTSQQSCFSQVCAPLISSGSIVINYSMAIMLITFSLVPCSLSHLLPYSLNRLLRILVGDSPSFSLADWNLWQYNFLGLSKILDVFAAKSYISLLCLPSQLQSKQHGSFYMFNLMSFYWPFECHHEHHYVV